MGSTAADGTGDGGTLVVAGAPLGNVADASPRLRELLATADVIAAEDTRRVRRLARDLGVQPRARIVSYYDAVERDRLPGLIEAVAAGLRVALITDAGMPSISDPGYRLVAACAQRELHVTTVPGPSAVTTALALSGLPCDRFSFEGFLPRKAGERARRLAELAHERRTMVFFSSPRRLTASLAELAGAFGADRSGAICRELTKTFEEVVRGPLAELVAWSKHEVRGEVTLVVAGHSGAGPGTELPPDHLAAAVAERVAAGADKKSAITEVARAAGRPRRAVYQAVLDHRQGAIRPQY